MNIQQKIAKLLKQPEVLSHSECQSQIVAIGNRIDEIRARYKLIDNQTDLSGRWPEERLRIAETGTPQELIALDAELILLEAEEISLGAQRDALRRRSVVAESEESVALAKTALKAMPKQIELAEKAILARDQAVGELVTLQGTFRTARKLAHAGGYDAPVLSDALFDRLAVAIGWLKIEERNGIQYVNGVVVNDLEHLKLSDPTQAHKRALTGDLAMPGQSFYPETKNRFTG